MMLCLDNFIQNFFYFVLELFWLIYIIEFIQLKNVFGNFIVGLYFEDSFNQIFLFINIKFGIMDMLCYNNGKCKGIYCFSYNISGNVIVIVFVFYMFFK